MTGKDLIKYILDNDLVDKPIIQNGRLVGFMTVEEAAQKFDVGPATVDVWCQLGVIDSVVIRSGVYVPVTAIPKLNKEDRHDVVMSALEKYISEHY